MLTSRLLSTVACTSLLALGACDKDESLGDVESDTSAESESAGESEGESESSGETEGETDSGIACPTDAMICPDGTAVGRSGPDCEFDPCPGDTDGTGGETDGTGGETDGEPVCAPDDEYFEPAACPTKEGGGYVIEPGCQTECLIESPNCGDDSVCMPVEVNPCVCDEGEDCCAACAAGMTLCVPISEGEACDAIVGQTLRSVEEYECGIAKDGPVMCNWTITLEADGSYLWMYSDIGQGGDYACKDGVISVSNNPSLAASYDAKSGILTWDDIEYVVEE